MTTTVIITLCILILISYAFDLSSKHTKIPSVILLLILGWGVHQIFNLFEISLPELKPLLPIPGTVGLILIVLEGGLELDLNKSKKSILIKSNSVSCLLHCSERINNHIIFSINTCFTADSFCKRITDYSGHLLSALMMMTGVMLNKKQILKYEQA